MVIWSAGISVLPKMIDRRRCGGEIPYRRSTVLAEVPSKLLALRVRVYPARWPDYNYKDFPGTLDQFFASLLRGRVHNKYDPNRYMAWLEHASPERVEHLVDTAAKPEPETCLARRRQRVC